MIINLHFCVSYTGDTEVTKTSKLQVLHINWCYFCFYSTGGYKKATRNLINPSFDSIVYDVWLIERQRLSERSANNSSDLFNIFLLLILSFVGFIFKYLACLLFKYSTFIAAIYYSNQLNFKTHLIVFLQTHTRNSNKITCFIAKHEAMSMHLFIILYYIFTEVMTHFTRTFFPATNYRQNPTIKLSLDSNGMGRLSSVSKNEVLTNIY